MYVGMDIRKQQKIVKMAMQLMGMDVVLYVKSKRGIFVPWELLPIHLKAVNRSAVMEP
jgi:hypothetical protein